MGPASATDSIASLRRAAILLTTLEPAVARRMLDALPPVRRAEVRRAMTALVDVDPLERKRALQDFLAEAAGTGQGRRPPVPADTFHRQRDGGGPEAPGTAAARPVTTAPSADAGQANLAMPEAAPLAFLGDVRDDVLLSAVAGEHPQTVAIVLASLAPHQAARLLPRLDESLRRQAMMRLGRLDHLPPDALDSIGDHLRRLLADAQPQKIGGGAGGRSLRAILAEMPHETRASLAQALDLPAHWGDAVADHGPPAMAGDSPSHNPHASAADGELRIAGGTQTLDPLTDDHARPGEDADGTDDGAECADSYSIDRHLTSIPPHRLRDALAAVEARDALLALCGLEAEIADAVLALLPRRQARQVRKQLQTIGPLRLRDIDHAKQRVAAAAGMPGQAEPSGRAARLPIAA